jgi:hypothetical protein
MTQEEKAKAYDESMDRAKKELDACGSQDCEAARQIFRLFPELREDEYERIRKELLSVVNDLVLPDEQQSRFVAWLEKQGSQDNAEDVEEPDFFDDFRKSDIEVDSNEDGLIAETIRYKKEKQGEQKDSVDRYFEGFKHGEECVVNNYGKYGLQKATEWSEEDERHLNSIIKRTVAYGDSSIYGLIKDDIDWLKSLKGRVQQQKQMWSIEDEYNQAWIVEMLYGLEDEDKEYEKKCRKMAEWLKMRFSTSSLEVSKRLELVNNMANLKWREFPAPTWLRTSMLRAKENGKGSQQNSVESQRTLKGVNDAVPVPAVVKDYQAASNIADLVAKALYAHIHGESATAQLSVLPDMRFGFMGDITLEEHIGEVIHILPNESSDSHLAMSGMLEGVQFEYSAGQSASCKYNIMLSRVRPYDAGEQPIECPLYVKAY